MRLLLGLLAGALLLAALAWQSGGERAKPHRGCGNFICQTERQQQFPFMLANGDDARRRMSEGLFDTAVISGERIVTGISIEYRKRQQRRNKQGERVFHHGTFIVTL